MRTRSGRLALQENSVGRHMRTEKGSGRPLRNHALEGLGHTGGGVLPFLTRCCWHHIESGEEANATLVQSTATHPTRSSVCILELVRDVCSGRFNKVAHQKAVIAESSGSGGIIR